MAPALLDGHLVSGILGKISFDRHETPARAVLEQMIGVLQRGQRAATAIHLSPGIALGWCGAPDAPARDEGIVASSFQTARVVADSALTHTHELRAALEQHGHHCRTGSDAELIAHAYDAWGDGCVERLRGPFACAIWDQRRGRLLLARDHVGIRPLYFALLHGRGVVFASEIRALLQDPGVGRECCPEAIDAYLALGYVPAPLTACRRVSKLEPAQRLIVDGRRLHVEQFWDLPAPSDRSANGDDLADEMDARLRTAVAACRGGDAPVTLYSGGPASMAILAAKPPAMGRTVTVATGDAGEWAAARVAARHLGHEPATEHAALGMPDLASRLAANLDEPIADPDAVVLQLICAAASRQAASALSGHGAAALFAGDARDLTAFLDAAAHAFAHRGSTSPFRHALRRGGPGEHFVLPDVSLGEARLASGLWDDDQRHALYTPGFAWQVRDANPFVRLLELYAGRDGADPEHRALYVHARTFLPESTLAMVERAASAAGIQLRFPYLQHELLELAARTPPALRQPGAEMRALRDVLVRRLPQPLVPPHTRPDVHPWLQGTLAALVPGVLLSPRFDGRGIVSQAVVRHVWDEHRSGGRDHARRLWSLLMLELWLRHFVDGDAAEEPVVEDMRQRAA